MTDINPYIYALQKVAEDGGFKHISRQTLVEIFDTYIERFQPRAEPTTERQIAALDAINHIIPPPPPVNVISIHRKPRD